MTDTEVDLETQANRIAARGREAIVERMRTAYGDAAAAHADLISLDDERIEAMVQSAADRADGLQWRRALAAVAADELGLSSTEALSHPAVVRAQALVGAPSYEQSLAELIARPVPLPAPAAPAAAGENGSNGAVGMQQGEAQAAESGVPESGVPEPQPPEPQPPLPEPTPEPPAPEPVPEPLAAESVPEPSAPEPAAAGEIGTADVASDEDQTSNELETVQADDVVLELLPEPDPIEYSTEAYDVEASFAEERVPPAPVNPFASQTAHEAAAAQEAEQQQADEQEQGPAEEHGQAGRPAPEESEVVVPAIHLGGVANLPTKREGLSVRLSADGLDIMQGPRDIIGRLVWDEIEALEVPNLRARRRSKQVRARLVVRTPHGDASFDVPEISGDDLRERVEPLMRLYGGE